MAYKLMAVDIDGTLLNSQGILTEATRKAIIKGVEKGLIFTISTGRPLQGVEYLNEILNLDLPFITYNGAMVIMGKSKEILYEQKLSSEDANRIIELGKNYDTTIIIWSDNKLFVPELNDRVQEYVKISGVQPVVICDLHKLLEAGATKILWYDEIDKIEILQSEVGKHLNNSINFHTSRPMFLEFVDKNASKAIAMERLGEYFGIKKCEMTAEDGVTVKTYQLNFPIS